MNAKNLLLTATLLIFNSTLLIFNCSAQYTNLHNFANAGGDGINPEGALISDGTFLYGTTYAGGTSTYGTIFKVKTDGTGYTKLLDFNGTNGRYPMGSLVSDGTFLYGMTAAGGSHSIGVIFKIMPDGSAYADLHDFAGTNVGGDGSSPYGSLFYDGTFLYGTTSQGGSLNVGTIFKIKPDGTGYTILHTYASMSEGWNPKGDIFSDGTFLYGMNSSNACSTCNGNIFKMMPDGSGFTDLQDFSGGTNGNAGIASLISDGTYLYGMTSLGGTSTACPFGCGVLFKIKTDGTGYTDLHDFGGAPDGQQPFGSLISVGAFLYGMTYVGGTATGSLCTNGCGTIFKIKPDGSGYAKLVDFDFTNNGADPNATLFSDGTNFYGTTYGGGTGFYGTVFKLGIASAGIAENNEAIDFSVSPNPNSGAFTIQMNNGQLAIGNYQLSIYNVMGEKVYSSNISAQPSSINLDAPNGIYFLQLKTEQGTANKKIIIQK